MRFLTNGMPKADNKEYLGTCKQSSHLYDMDDSFDIPVFYQGKEVSFQAKLFTFGYTHKIEVSVYGHQVLFEPDEEKNYRAVLTYSGRFENNKQIDVELLKAISQAIESILKG